MYWVTGCSALILTISAMALLKEALQMIISISAPEFSMTGTFSL